MKSLKFKISFILLGLFVCFFNFGCPCSDYVNLYVFVGHLNPDECRKLASELGEASDTVRFLCPGEEVTICWNTSGQKIQLDPGFGIKDPSGMEYLKVQSDTTIKATPQGGCAGSREIKVKVVTEPTPSTWPGKWDPNCTSIGFEIHEQFVSKKIKAIDITATWQPTVTFEDGSSYTCTTPPFLDGFHQEEVFGFTIQKPYVTEAFSRKLRAVGHWKFVWKADCGPVAIDCFKAGFASYPFDITLVCD